MTSDRRTLDIIEPELAPGEQVRWVGMSSLYGLAVRATHALVIGFLVAIGPIVAEEAWPNDAAGWLIAVAFKAVFFFCGAALVRDTLLDLIGVNRTAYAITDRRMLIVRLAHRACTQRPSRDDRRR